MSHKQLETKRLILRNLIPDDYMEAFKWCGDPRVNKYMIYPLYKNADDVKAWIETLKPDNPNTYDYGFVLKETGELIGSGGMYYHPEMDVWSVGYNLRYDMWNRGFTTEAIRAIIDYVCSKCEVKAIEAEHAIDNPASGRVMEKLGLKFARYGEYKKMDGSETFAAKIYRLEL